jgi:hypothetical protein
MADNSYVILSLTFMVLSIYLVETNAQTITTAPYPTPVSLRFPLVEYYPELSVIQKNVGDNKTVVTLSRTITGIAQEHFEVTDELTTYLLKYSKTKTGPQTVTRQSACAGKTKEISFCSIDKETTENGIRSTSSTTINFEPPITIEEYWLAGTGLLPVPFQAATMTRHAPEPTETPIITSEYILP